MGTPQCSCYALVVMLLSAKLNSSAAQLLLSHSQEGDLVGHLLRFSNGLQRVSRPSYEPLYTINTSHRKQKTFLYEYYLH
jgi:hypothetical protein